MSGEDSSVSKLQTVSKEDILLEVGRLLKGERQRTSTSIDTVANALNLRESYLKALEAGDWSNMPGEVYALGFLRQYADYLNLNLDDSIEKLKSGHYHLTKPLTFPDPPVAPKKSWMIFAAVAFVLLFIILNIFDHTPAPLPSQLMQNSAVTMQNADEITHENNIPSTEKLNDSQQEEPIEQAITTSLPSSKDSTLKPTLKIEQKAQVKRTDINEVLTYNYKFTAVTNDVWLQLHDSNEPPTLIREALLKKGESMQVTYSKPLRLTSGNALSLKITLNKQVIIQVNQLGEKGKVLRSYLLQKNAALP